jgi:hypothetical protein
LFILIGARPNTGWLADTLARDANGFLLTGPTCPPAVHAVQLAQRYLRELKPMRYV